MQQRAQRRVQMHLGHLDNELQLRQLRLAAGIGDKQRTQALVAQLFKRKHKTYKNLQTSMHELLVALENDFGNTNAGLHHGRGRHDEATEERLAVLRDEISETTIQLRNCYYSQAELVDQQVAVVKNRLLKAADEEKPLLIDKLHRLSALAKRLKKKADDLNEESTKK